MKKKTSMKQKFVLFVIFHKKIPRGIMSSFEKFFQ